MKPVTGLFVVVLALSMIPSSRSAALTSWSWTGTTPDTGVEVSFQADLQITGDLLTIDLFNNSLDLVPASPTLNPNDLLTSFYFDIVDGLNNRPTLAYVSAVGDVYLADPSLPDPLSEANADLVAVNMFDDTWQFRDGLTLQPGTDLLTFGIGTVGNNTLSPNGFNGSIVDGMDYGIYAGDVSTANLMNQLLVKKQATFTFSGVSGFTESDIADQALFGLGTKPDSTALVPEPTSGLLLGVGLLGLAHLRRRRATLS